MAAAVGDAASESGSALDLVDSHCHLDVAEFAGDRDAVIAAARAAGVRRQVLPAISLAGFEDLRALCATHAGLYPAYGLHPMFLAEHETAHVAALRSWIERERPVAVGECGLDLHVDGLDAQRQQDLFAAQLDLAREFELPVIVHARRAVEQVTLAFRRHGIRAGVVHSFSGSVEQARQLWDLGLCIGLGGPITYPRAQRLRSIVASMPLEFLLLETDSPDQPLCGHQGQRNEPGRLREVCDCVAQLRGVDAASVARATTANAERVFGLR